MAVMFQRAGSSGGLEICILDKRPGIARQSGPGQVDLAACRESQRGKGANDAAKETHAPALPPRL